MRCCGQCRHGVRKPAHDAELMAATFSHVLTLADGRELGYCFLTEAASKMDLKRSRVFFMLPHMFAARLAYIAMPKPYLDSLTDAHICPIGVERPGSGVSTFYEYASPADWAADLLAVADHLQLDAFGVVGVSLGGLQAAAMAATIPPSRLRAVGMFNASAPWAEVKATGLAGEHPVYGELMEGEAEDAMVLVWRWMVRFPKVSTVAQYLLFSLLPRVLSHRNYLRIFESDLVTEEQRDALKKQVEADPSLLDKVKLTYRDGCAHGAAPRVFEAKRSIFAEGGWSLGDIRRNGDMASRVLIYGTKGDRLCGFHFARWYHQQLPGSRYVVGEGGHGAPAFDGTMARLMREELAALF